MTYRDDLDALAARQASLQVEVDRSQRELARVNGLLAEAQRVEQAASYFERAPDLRRRQRYQLAIGALVMVLGSGAAVGAVAATESGAPQQASSVDAPGLLVRIRTARDAHEQAQRVKAELEALRVLGLIPMIDDQGRKAPSVKPTWSPPRWTLGPTPAAATVEPRLYRSQFPPPPSASLAREDER